MLISAMFCREWTPSTSMWQQLLKIEGSSPWIFSKQDKEHREGWWEPGIQCISLSED